MTRVRTMDPSALLVGGILFAIIIVPILIYTSHYVKNEAMLRDLPEKISLLIHEAKYKEADKLVAKAEINLGKTPNNMTPLRAVTQLQILAMNTMKSKSIENGKLAKIKENLLKFKPITNGYRSYWELVQASEKLVKIIEDSKGRIFFDKKTKLFKKSKISTW